MWIRTYYIYIYIFIYLFIYLFRGVLLILRKKLVKYYIWSITLYGAENWGISESRSQIPGKF